MICFQWIEAPVALFYNKPHFFFGPSDGTQSGTHNWTQIFHGFSGEWWRCPAKVMWVVTVTIYLFLFGIFHYKPVTQTDFGLVFSDLPWNIWNKPSSSYWDTPIYGNHHVKTHPLLQVWLQSPLGARRWWQYSCDDWAAANCWDSAGSLAPAEAIFSLKCIWYVFRVWN